MNPTVVAALTLSSFIWVGCGRTDSNEDVQALTEQLQKDRYDLMEVAKAMPFSCSGSLEEARMDLERLNGSRDSGSAQDSETRLSTISDLENYIGAIETGRAKSKVIRNRIDMTEEKLERLTGAIPKWPPLPLDEADDSEDPFK